VKGLKKRPEDRPSKRDKKSHNGNGGTNDDFLGREGELLKMEIECLD